MALGDDDQRPFQRAVFLRPRPRSRAQVAREDRSPYPRWFTVVLRTTLTGFEIGAIGYVVWSSRQMQNEERHKDRTLAIAGVATAAGIDGIVALLALFCLYEAGVSALAALADLAPALMCLFGYIVVVLREVPSTGPRDGTHATSEVLVLVVSVVHFVCSFGGCVGCCITCGRHSAAKRAKREAASGIAVRGGNGSDVLELVSAPTSKSGP